MITFTEKAAAKLSTRVRDELERRASATSDDEERQRLHRAARDLYGAHIETIHSFAAALLESGSLQWPRRGGLNWPHLASVVVVDDVDGLSR